MDNMLVPNEGIKRRLPLWMLGDQGSSKSETVNLNNTSNDDKGCEEDEERIEKCSKRAKSKSRKKGNDDGKLKLIESSSTLLVKCRERKQTRKEVITRDDEISHDDDDINAEVARKNRKCRQKGKTSFQIKTDKDVEVCHENGGTEDLTVEDLMSIAKEYVQEDSDAQVVVSSEQRDMAGSQSQDIAQSGSSLNVTDPNRILFESQGTSSCSMTENLTNDPGFKPTMSGNPTQDMLDLLLGPLLKKTQEQEKENRLITEETSFTYEVKKQHSNVDHGEEPIVVVKKKSSLRDKVAMFLD